MLITFSGLDGAGKSTLVRWLQQTLERQNQRVVVFHMNDHVGVYAYLRQLRDQLGGAPPRSGGGGDGGGGGGALRRMRDALLWGKVLRRVIYPLDLLLFLAYRLYHESFRRRVVIMDRYFYDTLVDVADGRHWGVLRLLQRLTPTPDVAVLLDVGPEESYARKRDYPVEYLRHRWLAYRTVFPWVRGALVIRNDDLHAAQQAVARLVGERLAA
jgi:thymidylate kinase